jgi:hypothetical protein
VIEALRAVSADAEVMIDERAGTSSEFESDKLAWHGIEYLSALFAWYDAVHPETIPKPEPEPPPTHDPKCVFIEGHEGECLPSDQLSENNPATGAPWVDPPKWPPSKVGSKE